MATTLPHGAPVPSTPEAVRAAWSAHVDGHAPVMLHQWQRGVPVQGVPYLTPSVKFLLALAAVGVAIATSRLFTPLAPLAGMSDAYAWGVWKTFNIMTLTALGSGALGVGLAAWVFDRRALHSVMRVALLTSFLFYSTGLVALGADMGRPWNYWNAFLPSHWNVHSALFEVALAMPLYCGVFLLFECSPMLVERAWYHGTPAMRAVIRRWDPRMRRVYPYVVAGAYLVPLGHQSSLGALMLLAGHKVDPLWQTQLLPLLYVWQAIICGFAFVTFLVMASCLVWRRPLDLRVLDELARWVSGLSLGWLAVRVGDLAVRGALGRALEPTGLALLLWIETACVAVPAVLLLRARTRATPAHVFRLSALTIVGGMLFRFVPTTIAFRPNGDAVYFPAVPELLMTVGFLALALALWTMAVKWLAVLPAPLDAWYSMVRRERARRPNLRRDAHGNPVDD